MASAQPEPTVTTSRAPIVGPRTVRPLRVSDSRALAGWSWPRGTSWGSMLAIAGNEIAETAPWTAERAMSIHSSAVPVRTRNGDRALGERRGDVGDLEDQGAREAGRR